MPSSSSRWLQEHFSDPFVKAAREAGYRSRAVYKLQEIHKRDRLFKPGMTVIDLGAAPGSWSQFIYPLVHPYGGRLIAVDILPIEPLEGVEIIEGDFTEPSLYEMINQKVGVATVDWVVSDMAPNMSGHPSVDVPKSIALAEMVLEFAIQVVKPTGGCLIKIFQGAGFDAFLAQIKKQFVRVVIRKPEASRDRSREVFVLAVGRRC